MAEYEVTVCMTKTDEYSLVETVTVEAESEEEAVEMVEAKGEIALEDENKWHGHWVYSCLNDQQFDSVTASCLDE